VNVLPRSLRGRLTLVFSAVAALAVGAFAWALTLLVEHAVWAPLDAGLAEEATTLAALVDLPAGRLAEAVQTIGAEPDLGPGKFVRVVGADHKVIASFRTVPPFVAGRRPKQLSGLQLLTVGEGAGLHRVVWTPGTSGGWVVLGVRAGSQAALCRRAKAAIGTTALGLIALLTALAWAVSSRATFDLNRLATELETIEAGSLDRRLAARPTSEVNRVVDVLNRMLGRLESAVTHLKRFTADAAHELRTPVAALRAYLEAAIARATTLEEHRAGLVDALEQTERLQRLGEDLLTLSAVESDAPSLTRDTELVRFDVLVHEVAESLAPIAEEQHRAFTHAAPTPVTLRGVPSLLKRVVLNLVDNAFRHTPEGTPIQIVLSTRDGLAALEVEDCGPGIAAGELSKVFERFRKGAATGGSGLGLALVQEIASRHGGRVTLIAKPEGGVIATVLLPLVSVPAV
jgi:two-component system OmpR family sensor kinase